MIIAKCGPVGGNATTTRGKKQNRIDMVSDYYHSHRIHQHRHFDTLSY